MRNEEEKVQNRDDSISAKDTFKQRIEKYPAAKWGIVALVLFIAVSIVVEVIK